MMMKGDFKMIDQRIIYKYRLPKGGSISYEGPVTQVVEVQLQKGSLTACMENELYKEDNQVKLLLVNDVKHFWRITFWVIGTDWPYERSAIGEYFKTVQDEDAVWHIFVHKEKL